MGYMQLKQLKTEFLDRLKAAHDELARQIKRMEDNSIEFLPLNYKQASDALTLVSARFIHGEVARKVDLQIAGLLRHRSIELEEVVPKSKLPKKRPVGRPKGSGKKTDR